MVIADFSGNYLNSENSKEGDIVKIATEGVIRDKKTLAGKAYKQLDLDVELNSRILIHSPTFAEGKKLVAAWGKDTKNWITKQAIVHLVRVSGGKLKPEIEPLEQKI